MERLKTLLSHVSIVNKKNQEILDTTGGRFNMFKICGVNHYEITHSAIIAEFLNPNGTHGLKSKLLECFLETLGENFIILNFDLRNAIVRTEHTTAEGRIDLLIEDSKNRAIIIENKIYARDQLDQLKRYNKYAGKYRNGYQILYLTLFGEEASEQSAGEISYFAISHKVHIIDWLERCVAASSRHPIVRETLIQYINHLKQLTHQDMDNKNREEITEILSKIENLRAAQIISQNYSATFNYLAIKYFNPQMEKFAIEENLEYHYERSDESYVRFHFIKPGWKGKCWIGFSFEAHRCFYGLCNNPDRSRLADNSRRFLQNQLLAIGVSGKETEWWPFYSYYTNLNLDTWENEIINSANFAVFCKEKTTQILVAMEGMEL